jgi:hypothetical protein
MDQGCGSNVASPNHAAALNGDRLHEDRLDLARRGEKMARGGEMRAMKLAKRQTSPVVASGKSSTGRPPSILCAIAALVLGIVRRR